jgi:hypothetical protein
LLVDTVLLSLALSEEEDAGAAVAELESAGFAALPWSAAASLICAGGAAGADEFDAPLSAGWSGLNSGTPVSPALAAGAASLRGTG